MWKYGAVAHAGSMLAQANAVAACETNGGAMCHHVPYKN